MTINISPDSDIPLNMQLLNQLRQLILSGAWGPGSRIPSETQLQKELGISRTTIRNALAKAESEGLIVRVRGRATYVAETSAKKAQHLLGYVARHLEEKHHQDMLFGAESVANARGYRIVFSASGKYANEEDGLMDELVEDGIKGILLWPDLNLINRKPSQLFDAARNHSVPVVVLDRAYDGLEFDCVTSDNYNGASKAVSHLIDLGHSDIIFVRLPILAGSSVAERYRGYQDAMRYAGLTPLEPLLVGRQAEMTLHYALRGYLRGDTPEVDQIRERLQTSPRPTAIFAVHDFMALQALKAAELAGLDVPRDLSVVGFDDNQICAEVGVPLTTVAQDAFAIGRRAAELLIDRFEGYKGPLRMVAVPTDLRIRASTAKRSDVRNEQREDA